MNRVCNSCTIEIDQNNYMKNRTVCKCCYHKNRKNNNNTLIQNQQTKTDIINKNIKINTKVQAYDNYAYVVIGPRYYLIKLL